jgi:hypothetical protein
MSSSQDLPERPAEAPEGSESGEKLSKKALKKLEKEKEKVCLLHHNNMTLLTQKFRLQRKQNNRPPMPKRRQKTMQTMYLRENTATCPS